MKKILGLPPAVLMALAGCGGTQADVQAYQQSTQAVTSTVSVHRDNTQATNATPQDCEAERQRYVARVRPQIEHMQRLSSEMDGCMRSGGHPQWADMGGMCNSMTSELDRYQQTACSNSNVAQNQGDAARHCDAMAGYTRRAQERANSAGTCGGVMGGGMMGGGGGRGGMM